ncbi:Peroxidase [Rhynchospora pubera]|uniref:Peroxidase n=1 Tax=Rhynchospora pubera TaxID=906938 RepID=A0AAV8EHR7_9POAL|nr:Peroxidase [Rhynchospora pubera]
MAEYNSISKVITILFLLFLLESSSGQLDPNYYYSSCPQISDIVKTTVESAIANDARLGASLLRLFFHDCFVNGCDGSVLLDDTPTFTGEKTANPNNGSLRGFEVIDHIKQAVEEACPGVVSCADILTIATRDSVVTLGGPYWDVKLGRRDSKRASLSKANKNLPTPISSLSTLTSKFAAQGLSLKDMVALSGAHTIGKSSCVNFRSHVYQDSNINGFFANFRQSVCPPANGIGDNNLAPLDLQTETGFDNSYFQNLIMFNGLLHSDQELFNGGPADSLVLLYSTWQDSFFEDFVEGMIKMGDIRPLTGSKGEIRKNCRKIN